MSALTQFVFIFQFNIVSLIHVSQRSSGVDVSSLLQKKTRFFLQEDEVLKRRECCRRKLDISNRGAPEPNLKVPAGTGTGRNFLKFRSEPELRVVSNR